MKKLEIKDILEALFLAMIAIFIIGIFNPSFLSFYHNIPNLHPIYYFDIFVRNGIFKFILVPFIIIFSYWLGKEKFCLSTRNNLIFSMYCFFAFYFIIYMGMPFYFNSTANYSEIRVPEDMPKTNETGLPHCNTIHFLYSPTDGKSMKQKEIIDKLKNSLLMAPIENWCVQKNINDDIICLNEMGIERYENSKSILNRFSNLIKNNNSVTMDSGIRVPSIIIGCDKAVIDNLINEKNLNELICTNFEDVCNIILNKELVYL